MSEKKSTSIYLENLERILQHQEYDSKQLKSALFSLFNIMIEDMSSHLDVHFTTLFSRCSFIATHYHLNRDSKFYLHLYRRLNEKEVDAKMIPEIILLAQDVITSLDRIIQEKKGSFIISESTESVFPRTDPKYTSFYSILKGIAVNHLPDEKAFLFISDEDGTTEVKVHYDVAEANEMYTDNIEAAFSYMPLPIGIHLVDVQKSVDGNFIPKGFVLDPDYLVDVTSVASCFKSHGIASNLGLLNKFFPIDVASLHLLLGNVANMMFDKILTDPSVSFEELLPEIFRLNPLGIAGYNNEAVKELVGQARNHYDHLKDVILHRLKPLHIERKHIYLEPTFYSMLYGLQGRLDLFHNDPKHKRYDIVELKSGSQYRTNAYGLNVDHYVQTLMYDLMVKSAFGNSIKSNNYILYSKVANGLKYAPALRTQQLEGIMARNELVLLDQKLSKNGKSVRSVFQDLSPDENPELKGFDKKKVDAFSKVMSRMDDLEMAYFTEFVSFNFREQRLSKVGEHGLYNDNGLAGLWREVDDEKEKRFSLLKHMTIIVNNSQESNPTITLEKSSTTSELANFRVGDIVVLFPTHGNSYSVLENQLFKCTIIELGSKYVKVKLRSQQFNTNIFDAFELWNIEQDVLDSSYNASLKSLYAFAELPSERKRLLLGITPPMSSTVVTSTSDSLTDEQNGLVEKALSAQDYYLLWGPPGTGKTSVMIKRLIELLHRTTKENILLLAYTNRAVDEICEALSRGLGSDSDYIRIGSTYGCHIKYRGQLLKEKIKEASSRQAILDIIQPVRIYVGTISSILGKTELFDLIKFDRVIIDEASQILEPLILGVLSRIPKFILIGDHRQLPAVVQQEESKSKIENVQLRSLGVTDMSMSFFERLYHQCRNNGWHESLGILTYQGRMHQDLMKFPNVHFYEGKLQLLPGLNRLFDEQDAQSLMAHRLNYIPTIAEDNLEWKTNHSEAEMIAQLILRVLDRMSSTKMEFHDHAIGVIAPYRAQIALIKNVLREALPQDIYEAITVDTVERYQGGARDIIILSLCTNNPRQFQKLISLSSDGIDRKLNVAITRAKEYLFILGNESVIQSNDLYHALIAESHRMELQ